MVAAVAGGLCPRAIGRRWSRGRTTLPTCTDRFGPAGVAICYELSNGRALAKAAAEGADWLLSIANLDPYPELLQRQFLALAQLRAIESGRDLLSVGNTGPTAVVRADGAVQRLLPPNQEGVALAELQRRTQRSAYGRLVGWLSSR